MRKKRAQRLVSTADSVSVAPAREPVLGIDFGTLYSSAAVCVDGRVSFALDGGDAAIPTMVYVPTSGPLVVGREALRLGFSDPFNVVTSVKRLLGLGWGDPALRALDAGSSFALLDEGTHKVRAAECHMMNRRGNCRSRMCPRVGGWSAGTCGA